MHQPPAPSTAAAPPADKAALAALGERVRARLAADPGAWPVPTDKAEIFAFANFLAPDECQRMIELVEAVCRPSTVFASDDGRGHRTSYSGDVDRADPFVRMIERRMDDLLGIEPEFGESIQGQRYYPGQEFKAHCDWFWTNAEYWPTEKRRGGQRSWTAMVWLNAVDEGGLTEFPEVGLAFPPQAGALLVWNNASPDGSPNWNTMHAAQPVVRGVKYVMTKWYRTRKWG